MARTIEQIDAEIARLKEERKQAQAREREADAKGEEIAKTKIGDLVLSFYPKGWRSVDADALAEALLKARDALSEQPTEPVEVAANKWKKLSVKKLLEGASARNGE